MTAALRTIALLLTALLWTPPLHAGDAAPSKALQDIMKEARRQADEIDALCGRLRSMASAHRRDRPSGVSPEEREDLRQRTDGAAWRLEELMKRYWAADATERAVQGARIIGGYSAKKVQSISATDVMSVIHIDAFPKEMEDAIGRAHAHLAKEDRAFADAEARRAAAARRRRIAVLACVALPLALLAALWGVRVARRRPPPHIAPPSPPAGPKR